MLKTQRHLRLRFAWSDLKESKSVDNNLHSSKDYVGVTRYQTVIYPSRL